MTTTLSEINIHLRFPHQSSEISEIVQKHTDNNQLKGKGMKCFALQPSNSLRQLKEVSKICRNQIFLSVKQASLGLDSIILEQQKGLVYCTALSTCPWNNFLHFSSCRTAEQQHDQFAFFHSEVYETVYCAMRWLCRYNNKYQSYQNTVFVSLSHLVSLLSKQQQQ